MKVFKTLKKILQTVDLFGTSAYFRYKSEQSFQSFFGGIVSIFIILAIGTIFYDRFSKCIDKVNIYSTESKIIQTFPPQLDISAYPKGKFMAALEVSDQTPEENSIKYFDYTIQMVSDSGVQRINLEPCTIDHWSGDPQILKQAMALDLSKMYCIPTNTTVSVSGKASYNLKYVIMSLKKFAVCTLNNGPLQRCATKDQYQTFFASNRRHKFQVYFTNYQIIPSKPDHIRPYIDDRYFGYFTDKKGSYTALYLQDFTVNTDDGISFFQYPRVEKGALQYEPPIAYSTLYQQDIAKFFLENLSQKVQDVFSFVGCLYGIMCAALFIVKLYNNTSYSISLGAELFESNKIKQKNFFKKYRFINYLKQIVYKFLRTFGFSLEWKQTAEYVNCQKQGAKYFDILHLLQRLIFLQNSISVILQKPQQIGLHLRQKLTLEQADNRRELANFKKKVKQVRQSKLIQKDSFISNVSDSDRKQFQIDKDNSNDDLARKMTIEDRIAVNYKNQSNFLELEEKAQQSNNQSSEQSSQQMEQNNNRKSITHQDIVSDLIKIQKEVMKNKRISKKILKLPSLNISGLQNQSLNRKSTKQFIKPQTFIESQSPFQSKQLQVQNPNIQLQKLSSLNEKGFIYAHNVPKKSKILNLFKTFLKAIDIFQADHFLQYRSQLHHKTIFGGILSIMIMVGVTFIFVEKLMDCLNKTIIYSAQTRKFSNDPVFLEIFTPPKGNFMLSFTTLGGLNINQPKVRYFDYVFQNKISKLNPATGLWTDEVRSYTLEKCTLDHWGKSLELLEVAKKMDYQKFLCLPRGASFSIQGLKRSNEFRSLELVVKKCKNQTDPSRPCDYAGVNAFLTSASHSIWFQLTSVIINAQTSKYIQNYLEERTPLVLSLNMMIETSVYLDDYTVATDESIFPWVDELVEKGSMMTQTPDVSTYQNVNNTDGFARIKILKSVNSVSYQRSFDKLQNVLSFIRGIFGIIYALLFVVNFYNLSTYEVALCSKLFKQTELMNKLKKSFNFLSFLQRTFYSFILVIGFSPNWQSMKQYKQFEQQIERQLDVPSIFKRIDFLEYSIETILEDHEIMGIRLKQKRSINEAKEKREAFKLKKKFRKIIKRINENRGQELEKGNRIDEHKLENKNNTLNPINETQANESFVSLNKKSKKLVSRLNFAAMDHQTYENLKEIEQNQSSDSEDDEEQWNEAENQKLLQYIAKLQQGAKNGDKISEKIVKLTSKSMATLLTSHLDIFNPAPQNQQENQIKPHQHTIFDINEPNNQKTGEQLEKATKFNPFELKGRLWQKFN